MTVRKRAIVAAVMLSVLSMSARPAVAADDLAAAKVFLQTLYAGYRKDVSPSPDLRDGTILDRSLVDLWRRAEKGADGAFIDADPVCDCQDYDITAVDISVQPVAAGKAEATASFKNFDTPTTVRFDLVLTGPGWRIADIHDAPSRLPSLRKSLEAEIASHRHKHVR